MYFSVVLSAYFLYTATIYISCLRHIRDCSSKGFIIKQRRREEGCFTAICYMRVMWGSVESQSAGKWGKRKCNTCCARKWQNETEIGVSI